MRHGRAAETRRPAAPPREELVSLIGTPDEIGQRFGTLNASDIREHVDAVWADWAKRGLSEAAVLEKTQPFVRFCEKFGPHWLVETAACAQAAEVSHERYLAYLAGKYRSLFFTDDCTSFAAAGDATADGAAIFHKNRDNATRAQSAYCKRLTRVPGVTGFYATGDTSDLGLMMMVNDKGLAGSADTGGLKETHPKGRGVMNPYILRLIAERAERCEDALEIIQETIRDGWYAGGSRTGTHWLFADRFGTILRVAQNSVEEQHWYHRDTVVFLARGETPAATAMKSATGKLTVRDFQTAACSRDICFGSSISALTVRIDPKRAIAGGTVWFALPAFAPAIPLHTDAPAVPAPVVDGRMYRAGYELLKLRSGNGKTNFGTPLVFTEDYLERRRQLQDELYANALRTEASLAERNGDDPTRKSIASQAMLAAWERCRAWNEETLSGIS